jgi:CheY-like chemotaxis protein
MRSASILIIEDHASLRTLMAQVLEDVGMRAMKPPMAGRDSNGFAPSPRSGHYGSGDA